MVLRPAYAWALLKNSVCHLFLMQALAQLRVTANYHLAGPLYVKLTHLRNLFKLDS